MTIETEPDQSDPIAVDYSVQRLLSIRLINAPSRLVDAVAVKFGITAVQLAEEPDVQITFVERFSNRREFRYIGRNDCAFDNDHFYVSDSHGHYTEIPMEMLGQPVVLRCESGVASIALLHHIIALRLLQKGHVLMHASSFVYREKGVMVCGWEKGGKSETLLPFLEAGACYMDDENTVVSPASNTIRGIARQIHIWSWHFDHLPRLWKRISAADRVRLRAGRTYRRAYQRLPLSSVAPAPVRQLLDKAYEIAQFQGVMPGNRRLFGDRMQAGSVLLDHVFLSVVAANETYALPITAEDVARRMVASLTYERRKLLDAYTKFRYAFPDRRNELLETANERELELLLLAFKDKPAYEIRHPYPSALDDLFRVVSPLIG